MKKFSFLLLFLLTACATRGPLESKVLQGEVGEVDVIVFSSTDCPIANAMAPEIERIHQTVKSNGGDLFLIHVWDGRTYTDANVHAKEYGLTMEILVDSDHELVKKFNAIVTPEAVVISYDTLGHPQVIYQGLINNFFDSPGNRRDEASEHYVLEAILATQSNRGVVPSYRTPTGCVIEQKQ